MPALVTLAALVLCLILSGRPASTAHASEASAATDANLVTALDVSDSIMRHEEWIEFDGIARAVVHPAFLNAVLAGRHRRIGFAVYTWSSHGKLRVVVPWTVIGSADDAERVTRLLWGAPRIDRSEHYGFSRNPRRRPPPGFQTDISAAIRFGSAMIESAPKGAERAVINVCGNGVDNVGEGPERARDRALASGVTINGLVVGDKPEVVAYYRSRVVGGTGSFVLEVKEPAGFADAMVTKLLMDLVAVRGDNAPVWAFAGSIGT